MDIQSKHTWYKYCIIKLVEKQKPDEIKNTETVKNAITGVSPMRGLHGLKANSCPCTVHYDLFQKSDYIDS